MPFGVPPVAQSFGIRLRLAAGRRHRPAGRAEQPGAGVAVGRSGVGARGGGDDHGVLVGEARRAGRSRCRPRSPAIAPFDHAYSTASQNAQPRTPWSVPPPRLRLMTSAPWSAAQRIPAATSSADPVAVQRVAAVAAVLEHPDRQQPGVGRHAGHAAAVVGGRQRDAGHVGAVAVVVLARPAARRRVRRSAPMQLTWPTSCGARSSWARSTPESTTAMVMPSPVPRAHAPGAPMRSRPHWSPCSNTGSFGVASPASAGRERGDQPEPGTAEAASDRTDRRIHPSSVRTGAPGATRALAQRRRRTVTTLPKTDTSSASNSIGESRAFDGSSVTVLPLRR